MPLPGRPASRNWTPSLLAVESEISTTIASTSTCSRRVSSWRTTSPSWRCTSAGAAITIALAPSKRVTTDAVRPPSATTAGWPAAPPDGDGLLHLGLDVAAAAAVPARIAAGPAEIGLRQRRGRRRLGRRLADQLLEHRQQLFGIGIFEEDHLDLGAVLRAPVEILGDRGEPRDRRGIAAQRHRVRAVTATTLTLVALPAAPAPPAWPPPATSACNAVAISRAPAFFSAMTRVEAVSVSI